jgi:hypothetical protein
VGLPGIEPQQHALDTTVRNGNARDKQVGRFLPGQPGIFTGFGRSFNLRLHEAAREEEETTDRIFHDNYFSAMLRNDT